MEKGSRREQILKALKDSNSPLSGRSLAEMFSVSRQIVVGDIALLRAEGINVISTNSGYILSEEEIIEPIEVKVRHKSEDLYDVLCTIVDEGAGIKEVSVNHGAYGKITVPLQIENRADIRKFSEAMLESGDKSLGELSGGVHYYKIYARNQLSIIRAQKSLYEKGYIVK